MPGVVRIERNGEGFIDLIVAVIEPVVNLKLDPGGGKQVQGARRLEFGSCQELLAHLARLGSLRRASGSG